ncbi:ABC transporter permease subunit [Blastochloris viridis]|uniref:ABC transporter ATP-binding/permease protein n=1 Tax=Blastochloris viridis TaxID=1079 RepID=A0A0H5BEL9_BLAVI|nr:branched-chain amino acid ABC transporter ATP-binding protein/permease [Blastochloris viridis]ALK09453.1 Glutamine transport ATP-binding protein GlnQ [Blastochloris viridis]BAS00666.1 ABC transporter ATP-binding/permease protein [Blastochloris viridis]CUU42116.1 LIV-I protein F [Blastochloris viridis]
MSPRLALGAFVAALVLVPLVPGLPVFWITLLGNIGLAALVAMGLVLLTGVGGMTSFGQAAFCGFGAYATAVLSTHYGWSPWLALPVSLLVSGSAAVVLGLVTVRLSGHFLPLSTMAWGLSLYYLFGKIEMLGRHDGISAIPPLSLAGFELTDPRAIHYVIWGTVIAAAILTLHLLDSRIGRAIRALRRGQLAAESFGINVARIKLIVFVYAALLAGLSGWLYAHVQRTVTPTPFGISAGIEYLFMAVLGGAGQIWGAIVGAGLVTLLKEALQRLVPALFGNSVQIEGVVFGIALVALLQFAREGLWPHLARILPAPVRLAPKAAEALARRAFGGDRNRPLLVLDAARKQFAGLVAVNDVSFKVGRGEIVALIGPNGAGKSTTFNLITGVTKLTAGTVRFDEAPISGTSPQVIARHGIARTFQHVKLNPDMTVLENVALGAHLRGRAGLMAAMLRLDRRDEARLLAEAACQIERIGLAEHMMKPAGSLALGQQRMVEIARALAMDPELLLLDEPAAGLRHFEKAALADLLARLRAEGMSILLVEHDMGFVMGLTDHIVVLDFGTKIAEGPPDAIKTHPAVLEAYLGGAA